MSLHELIPVMIIAIPLTAVAGRHVLRPMLETVTRLLEHRQAADAGAERRIAALEERLGEMESQLNRVLEEQEFARLLERRAASSLEPPPTGPARSSASEAS